MGVLAFSLTRHSHGEDPSPLWDEPSNPGSHLMRGVSLDNWAPRTQVEIVFLFPGKYPYSWCEIDQLADVRSCTFFYNPESVFSIEDPEDHKGPLEAPQPWASCPQRPMKQSSNTSKQSVPNFSSVPISITHGNFQLQWE